MPYYEAIIGTEYSDPDHVPQAVAEAMWHLTPIYMDGPPIDVNVYGGDGEQMIGVGIVFETFDPVEHIEDCGAETVEQVVIR